MENAGAGAARVLREIVEEERELYSEPFHILCGPGNNGGDGLVVARHLHNQGFEVRIQGVGITGPSGSDYGLQLKIAQRMRLSIALEGGAKAPTMGTVIDALFGTGLSRPLRAPFLEWVEAVNASGRRVIALDIPSGLDANTGEVLGAAIRADHTITFAASKVGFNAGAGPTLTGKVHVVDIGIPRQLWEGL